MADSFFTKVGLWFETNWKWIAIGTLILSSLLVVATILLAVALSRSSKNAQGCERLLTQEQRQAMVISDPKLAKQGYRGAEEEAKVQEMERRKQQLRQQQRQQQQQQQQRWPQQQQEPTSSHYVKIGAPEVPPTPEFQQQSPYGQLALSPVAPPRPVEAYF